MILLPVPDPKDGRCPVPESEDRAHLLYHATSSVRAPDLEREGFVPDAAAFRIEDVQRVVEIYEELQFDGELGGLTPRAVLEDTLQHGGADPALCAFTPYYFTARNLAITRPWGETLRGLTDATAELGRLLSEPPRLDAHRRLLREWDQRESEQLGKPLVRGELPETLLASMQRRERALNAVEDPPYLTEALRKVRSVHEVCVSRQQGGHPVVYAIRVPPEERSEPTWQGSDASFWSLRAPLPASALLWRIDLPAGAHALSGSDPEEMAALGLGEVR